MPLEPTPVLAVRGLDVRLGGNLILDGVDVTLAAGAVTALLGGNGSGKTTLLRAVLGLAPHQAGTVEWFGQPQDKFRGWPRLGYVPQKAAISLHATTLAEVVHTGTLAYRHGAVRGLTTLAHRRRDRAVVAAALDAVGLLDQAKELFIHLSGGQQQRALLARALAQDPAVLVLDEPLAGVDLAHQAAIHDALAGFKAQGGSVLVVLHEVVSLAELVDHAVVLRGGRVAYSGPLAGAPDASHGHEHEPPAKAAGVMTGMEPQWTS
ncbi:MAG: ATP-binding cassette domain-containing protein [Propionibacteriaceae bacterium]|jgi:zinc transport system ATP-binding protein|nr:ATP-binding cassette domain-containing protein [Propionibacteriaceae bacterium]